MPGLTLTIPYSEEAAPKLYYASAGVDPQQPSMESLVAGCDPAMVQAARRGAASARDVVVGAGIAERCQVGGVVKSGGLAWRVFTLRRRAVVLTLVAHSRYDEAAGRNLCGRLADSLSPVLEQGEMSVEVSQAATALMSQELEHANAERLGLMASVGDAASCGFCGGSMQQRPLNCHVCGDVVCTECAVLEEAATKRQVRCSDCEHCVLSGRRLLRLRPPRADDATRTFAISALLEELQLEGNVMDEAAFKELCLAACRHPLIVDARSLARETRFMANAEEVPLDEEELGRHFKEFCKKRGRKKLRSDEVEACLSEACSPIWRVVPMALPEEEQDDKPTAMSLLASFFGGKTATSRKKRTGWGTVLAKDKRGKRRVWLVLDEEDEPRCLRWSAAEQSSSRPLVYLADVRAIRCDAACELELRSVKSEETRPHLTLRFETPAATCSWWSALSMARRTVKPAPRDISASLPAMAAEPLTAAGFWSQLLVACAPVAPPSLAIGSSEERPFLQLAASSNVKPKGRRADAKEEDEEEESTTGPFSGSTEMGDSLPERGFGLAGSEVKAAFQSLIKVIIRPPRATFDERRLGVKDFAVRQQSPHNNELKSVSVHREDLSVLNERGLEVRASTWIPVVDSELPPPCVIYVHGNACNRLSSLTLLRPLVLGGMSLCAVDCAGSGNSGGEFVSLGHYERDDLAVVVDELRRRKLVGEKIAVWGRSMGASTAILYAATRDPHVAAVVADSAYSSLVTLCKELVGKVTKRKKKKRTSRQPLPRSRSPSSSMSDEEKEVDETGPQAAVGLLTGVVAEAALGLVRSSVRHRAGFDIYDVAPIRHIANLRHSATPVLFVHGADDDFISPRHSRELHDAHGGDATVLLLKNADHQSPRPASSIIESCLFVFDRLAPRDAPPSARGLYARALRRLADDGHIGAKDHHNEDDQLPEYAAEDASGLDKARQKMLEKTLFNRFAFSRKDN